MLTPHLASDEDGPGMYPRAGAVSLTLAERNYPLLDHELRRGLTPSDLARLRANPADLP
jgi:hypothetical protein